MLQVNFLLTIITRSFYSIIISCTEILSHILPAINLIASLKAFYQYDCFAKVDHQGSCLAMVTQDRRLYGSISSQIALGLEFM